MTHSRISLLVVVLLTFTASSIAQLDRVGPNLSNGYPAWYQDKTGLTLEFCSPLTQSELDGGWCLLLPGDTVAPESFPDKFFDEHFYWAGNSLINYSVGKASLVLALEGAFASGPVIPGDQITFGRIRVKLTNLPFAGTYTVYHPFGVQVFPDMVAGDKIFFTDDIGITCPPGQFDCALASHIGPFLLPSTQPGGAEMPAIGPATPGLTTAYPGTGKLYVADPGRIGPVTGSPLAPFTSAVDGLVRDHNIFRVEGPNGFVIESYDFSLMGRIMSDTIPGRVTVDRASYAKTSAEGIKLDVFATAFPTAQGRLPANPKPPLVTPILGYYQADCGPRDPATGLLTAPAAGGTEVAMTNYGSNYWAGSAPAAVPVAVCVEDYTARNAAGQVVPAYYRANVTDVVTITDATFDPSSGGSFTVKAASSDQVTPGTLELAGFGQLTGGQITVTGIAAPPAKARVTSSFGGLTDLAVTVAAFTGPSATIPVAANIETTMNEDCSATTASGCASPLVINILGSVTVGGAAVSPGPNVTIAMPQGPRIGTATIDNTTGSIIFTPNPDTNGTEGIGFTVTVDGVASNQAYITIGITPVNDAPVALNDNPTAVVSRFNSVNVLANDTDVDGLSDLANAQIVTWPAGLGTQPATVTGGVVNFTPTSTGTFNFTYRALDKAGAPSNTATASVRVLGSESISIAKAIFRAASGRWVVSGTDTVPAGQTLTITYNNGTYLNGTSAAGMVIGTAVVDALGNWVLDFLGASGALNPTNTAVFKSLPTQVRVASPLGGSAVASIRLN